MRYALMLFAIAAIQGCVFVPYPAAEMEAPWNQCISAGQFVGDKVKSVEDARTGTVIRVYGKAHRCTDPRRPNLAEVRFD